MTTVRLEKQIEKKLEIFSDIENISKSEIIKKALNEYFDHHQEISNPYKLGEELFDRFGSGKVSNSSDYKNELKRKLREKYSH